jgi:hypothetical protein
MQWTQWTQCNIYYGCQQQDEQTYQKLSVTVTVIVNVNFYHIGCRTQLVVCASIEKMTVTVCTIPLHLHNTLLALGRPQRYQYRYWYWYWYWFQRSWMSSNNSQKYKIQSTKYKITNKK